MITIIDKLNALANLQAKRDVMRMDKAALCEQIIPPEIQQALKELNEEWEPKIQQIDQTIINIEAEIKREVEARGTSVKGQYLHAIYNAGRVTWDGKLLEGYAVAHPEILQARKVGGASVTIRSVRGG